MSGPKTLVRRGPAASDVHSRRNSRWRIARRWLLSSGCPARALLPGSMHERSAGTREGGAMSAEGSCLRSSRSRSRPGPARVAGPKGHGFTGSCAAVPREVPRAHWTRNRHSNFIWTPAARPAAASRSSARSPASTGACPWPGPSRTAPRPTGRVHQTPAGPRLLRDLRRSGHQPPGQLRRHAQPGDGETMPGISVLSPNISNSTRCPAPGHLHRRRDATSARRDRLGLSGMTSDSRRSRRPGPRRPAGCRPGRRRSAGRCWMPPRHCLPSAELTRCHFATSRRRLTLTFR